ncbi:MAG TPA: response regulator, partial [Puia sp.]|nr:response regulator [Puia sp.]
EVADTGMGMDEVFVQQLFDKFTQEYDSVTRKYGGTGLGMSICKELIELMDGEIRVVSKKGVGTSVTVIVELEKGDESDVSSPVDAGPVNAEILKDKKVLVVDDNDMNRLVATTILENYGTIIFEAGNGQEAVDFLRRQTVDVVLMDIQMPFMSGLEASELIRADISASLPIIALTANAIKGENERCLAAGMTDYLAKPFEENALLKMICDRVGQIPADGAEKRERQAAASPADTGRRRLYGLHRLEEIGQGDQVFVKKMVQLFVDTVPVAIQQLQVAAVEGDFQTVYAKAHSLKPSIHNFAIESLREDVLELERLAAAKGPAERIGQLARRLGEVVGKVVDGLRENLDRA